jgi:hypothetical protein
MLRIHHHLVHAHHHCSCLLGICHSDLVYHSHHLLRIHHLRRHVKWCPSNLLAGLQWSLLLLGKGINHLRHVLWNILSNLRLLPLHVLHLIHHVLLRTDI